MSRPMAISNADNENILEILSCKINMKDFQVFKV